MWEAFGVRLPAAFPSSPDRYSDTLRIEVGQSGICPSEVGCLFIDKGGIGATRFPNIGLKTYLTK